MKVIITKAVGIKIIKNHRYSAFPLSFRPKTPVYDFSDFPSALVPIPIYILPKFSTQQNHPNIPFSQGFWLREQATSPSQTP
jgi:hypothetical protein